LSIFFEDRLAFVIEDRHVPGSYAYDVARKLTRAGRRAPASDPPCEPHGRVACAMIYQGPLWQQLIVERGLKAGAQLSTPVAPGTLQRGEMREGRHRHSTIDCARAESPL
jgi:hypothetical protein